MKDEPKKRKTIEDNWQGLVKSAMPPKDQCAPGQYECMQQAFYAGFMCGMDELLDQGHIEDAEDAEEWSKNVESLISEGSAFAAELRERAKKQVPNPANKKRIHLLN